MRPGAAPHPLLIASLLFALLCAPARAFLYARCEVLSPPSYNLVPNLAVVNASARQAVIIHASSPDGGAAHLSLTAAFPSAKLRDYAIVTRPISPPIEATLAADDIFVDLSPLAPPGGVVWALFETDWRLYVARAISLLNASVVHEVNISVMDTISAWRMAERTDGSIVPVVANASCVCWPRANGSLACVVGVWFSAWGVVPGTDTLLALSVLKSNVSVWRAQLTDDASAASASPALPDYAASLTRTQCILSLNGSLAFLATVNETLALLLLPDPQTLALTLTPIRANLSGVLTWESVHMQCAASAVPNQYIVWVPLSNGSLRFFVLDPAAATLTPLAFDSVFSNWLNAAVSASGDVLLAACDSTAPAAVASCQLQWYPAFNASAPAVSVLDMPLPARTMEYESAAQPLPDVAVLSFFSLAFGPNEGFVVLRLGEEVDVLAWISVSIIDIMDTIVADPHSLSILFSTMPSSPFLYAVDWAAPPSLSALALLTDALPASTNPMTLAPSRQYPQLFYAALRTDWNPLTSTLYAVSLSPTFTTRVIGSLTDTITSITEDPTGATLYVTSYSDVYQVSVANNASVLNQWTYPHGVSHWFELFDSLIPPGRSILYLFLYDFEDGNASCAAIDFADPTRPMQFTITPPVRVDADMISSGRAVLANSFLYFGFSSADGQIAKFDLDCNFLESFTTALPAATQVPVISAPDAIMFALSPNLFPIYLDCGLGSFRNLSSGECGPCPAGSVSSVADTQACVPCPARTAPDALRISCLCSAGFYSATDSAADCAACPVGGVCEGNNTLRPAPGYWRSANDSLTRFYACPYAAGCNGSDACAAGYEGTLCAVCARGFALRANRCVACADVASTAVFWSVALVVYAAAFIVILYAGPSSMSVLKSFISFAQIVTFPTSGPMPRLLASKLAPFLSKFLSLANLQLLSIVSPDCLLRRHVTYPVEAVATALLPVATLLLIGAILALPWQRLSRLLRRNHSAAGPALAASDPFNEAPPDLASRMESYKQSGTPLRALLFVVLLATPSVTRELASFYTCRSVSGASYLLRDFAVRCDGREWRAFAAPVSILLALYALGVPLALWVLLVRFRARLDVTFLHSAYRDEWYWWELTEQARKLALLLLNAVLAPRHPSYYAPASLALSFVALSAHLQARPYKTSRDAAFQTADLTGVILFFLWAVTPPEDSAADVAAWLYWIFAVLYTLASLAALLEAPARRALAWVRWCLGARRTQAAADAESELDALLLKRSRGD